MEIMEGLRGHMSGLGIPTYVVDSPHGGGKIPVMPNYVLSASDDALVLRNYEGMLVRYQAEDKPTTTQPTATRGVSSLLQGTRSVLMPENSERMARRQLHVLSSVAPNTDEETEHHTTNGHTNGCCTNGNGHAHQDDLISLGVLANGCRS
jgi:lysine 2,3-aminomutase